MEAVREVKPTAVKSPGPVKPSAPKRAAVEVPLTVKRAEAATGTFEILSAGLTVWSMMSGAKARQQFTAAKDEKQKQAAQKKLSAAKTMSLDAAALAIHADSSGAALAEMADQNSYVAALVDRLELFNGVAGVATSLLPLVYQLMANHAPEDARDNMPPELMQMGVLPPKMLMEKLEAQNSAKMARVQAEILREKLSAERELADLQNEMSQSHNGAAHAAS